MINDFVIVLGGDYGYFFLFEELCFFVCCFELFVFFVLIDGGFDME